MCEVRHALKPGPPFLSLGSLSLCEVEGFFCSLGREKERAESGWSLVMRECFPGETPMFLYGPLTKTAEGKMSSGVRMGGCLEECTTPRKYFLAGETSALG